MFGTTTNVLPAVLLCFVTTSNIVQCDDNLFVTIEEVPGPGSNTSVVGPPGPLGLVGLPGPKGTTGRIGNCQCDIERIRRLDAIVKKSKDIFHDNKAERATFNFKQNPDVCSVGIKTGRLRDSAMTASSFSSIRYAPFRARLDNLADNTTNRGSWLPDRRQESPDKWIQVDLDQPTEVTGIITQGYQYFEVWTASFKISYTNHTDKQSFIQEGEEDKIFIGNHDRASYRINMFPKPITARYFRLYVVTFQKEIALRMDLLTC